MGARSLWSSCSGKESLRAQDSQPGSCAQAFHLNTAACRFGRTGPGAAAVLEASPATRASCLSPSAALGAAINQALTS